MKERQAMQKKSGSTEAKEELLLSAHKCENQDLSDSGGDARSDPNSHQRGRPEVVEEWKWRGVPVWSHAGIICTGETYKNVVKMTSPRGRL